MAQRDALVPVGQGQDVRFDFDSDFDPDSDSEQRRIKAIREIRRITVQTSGVAAVQVLFPLPAHMLYSRRYPPPNRPFPMHYPLFPSREQQLRQATQGCERRRTGGECDAVTLKQQLLSALGRLPDPTPLNTIIRKTIVHKKRKEIHFDFSSEEKVRVPAVVLLPASCGGPWPLVVCLQGHNAGMRLSLGEWHTPKEWVLVKRGHRDLGVQGVARQCAVLAIEQRCFGMRPDARPPKLRQNRHTCQHLTMTALLLGRTMIGERVWDLMRSLDAVAQLGERLDMGRIACVGHSAGGTTAWYGACLDDRISVVVPSCSLCRYNDSIGTRDHCMDNYLPGALQHFDMGDLAALVYPRTIISVVGNRDRIFPLQGTRAAFETVRTVYERCGGAGECSLQIGSGGHQVYPHLIWPLIAAAWSGGGGCAGAA